MSKKKNKRHAVQKVTLFYTLTYENGVTVQTSGKAKLKNGVVHVCVEPCTIKSSEAVLSVCIGWGREKRPCQTVDGQLMVR